MFACALNMLMTTHGSIWSEWTVCKGSWCPWSTDVNSTSLQKKNNNKAIPSGQSSLRLIFNAIIYMRHTTYSLQNTHAIETEPHTHTHMPPSGQSSLRSIFNAIIHMRHTTYKLQNTHAIESKPHTPPPSDVSECLKVMNNDLRQCLKWMNSLQMFLMPLIQRCKQHLPTKKE